MQADPASDVNRSQDTVTAAGLAALIVSALARRKPSHTYLPAQRKCLDEGGSGGQ
jgi:hypothetical protein